MGRKVKSSGWLDSRKAAVAFTKLKSGKEKASPFGWQIKTLSMFGIKQYAAVPRKKPKSKRS